MDKRKLLKSVKEYLLFLKKEKYPVTRAYIFGSYNTKKFKDYSDVDVAIVMKTIDNCFDIQAKLLRIGYDFDNRIEPHPIEEKDFNMIHPIAAETIRHGKRIL